MSSSSAPKAPPAPDFETVLKQAKSLPKDQQLRLLDELAAIHDEQDIDPELRKELTARAQSISDGSAVLLDGREAVRELRAKFTR